MIVNYPVVLTEAVNAEPNQNSEQLEIEAQEILSDSNSITITLPVIDNVNIIDVSAIHWYSNNSSSNNKYTKIAPIITMAIHTKKKMY